jgi:hypothetical protein
MRLRKRTLLAVAMSAALASCNPTDVLGPVQPENVTITFSVSGGIAGVQFGVVVDGASGEARLDALGQADAVIPLSSAQIGDLARRLDGSDMIARGDRDFGETCCDMFNLDLIYERGERSVRLRGTQNLWPIELDAVLQPLFGLAEGRVPILVAPDTDESNWPQDPLSVDAVLVTGDALTTKVTYSGGCGQHRMDLVVWGEWLESFPVQVNGLLTHDAEDDTCEALISEDRVWGLHSLREAYAEAYGPIGAERPTVVLRLSTPGAKDEALVEIVL